MGPRGETQRGVTMHQIIVTLPYTICLTDDEMRDVAIKMVADIRNLLIRSESPGTVLFMVDATPEILHIENAGNA